MEINKKEIGAEGIKFFACGADGKEVARAYLYLMKNGLHKEPFGYMEDVYVDESLRGQGIGTELVNKVIETAKEKKCYKLFATSRYDRPKVHVLYEKIGFKDWGKNFRMVF
ncbi:MAG: GNAT family N-acetyltransferase [Patescibacteria group bacterium]